MLVTTRFAGAALVAVLSSACALSPSPTSAVTPPGFRIAEPPSADAAPTSVEAASEDGAFLVPAGAPGSTHPRPQEAVSRDDWTFSVAPYLWAISQKGKITARGNKADVDVSFNDILDTLDSTFLLTVGARKGDTVFRVDQNYLLVSDDQKVNGVRVDAEQQTYFATLKAGQALGDGAEAPIVFIGARYWNLDLDIEAFTGGTKVADFSGNKHWWDPLVGAEKQVPLDGPWSLVFSGDVGGFGIGTASEMTWQATALALREMEGGGALGFGWRHLSIDYSRGHGNDRFEFDLRVSGPLVGWIFRF